MVEDDASMENIAAVTAFTWRGHDEPGDVLSASDSIGRYHSWYYGESSAKARSITLDSHEDNQEFVVDDEYMDDKTLRNNETAPDNGYQTFYIEYNLFMSHQFVDGQVGVHVERNMMLPVSDPFNPRISFKLLLHACKDHANPTGRLIDHVLTLDSLYYVAMNTRPMTLTHIQGDLTTQMMHQEIGRLEHILDTAVGEERMGPCVSCEEKDIIDTGMLQRLPCFVLYLVPSLWNVLLMAASTVTLELVQTRPPTTPDVLTAPTEWVEWDLAYGGMIELLAELDRRPWNMAFK
ncbi:hypothetical protein F5146DRAFT_1006768 [Armillaria mellea]|nr:hypothetical protein F5146DRAFT_1006768 [Armillaria mellea]